MTDDCTVEMGSLERPTRFQVKPVRGSTGNAIVQQQNGNGSGGGGVVVANNSSNQLTTTVTVDGVDMIDGVAFDQYRRLPDHDAEANENDTFPVDGTQVVTSRRQSRYKYLICGFLKCIII